MAPSRLVCEAARSAAADSPCLGSGSATKTLAHACIGRLSVVAGTARARWCSRFAAVCCAEALPVTAAEADRALGPMLPASARERWPFCVLRDSCHAALLDQPGLPQNGSGRWTGGSRRRPRALRLTTDDHCVDAVGVRLCCVGSPLPDREKVVRTRLVSFLTQPVLCGAACVVFLCMPMIYRAPRHSGELPLGATEVGTVVGACVS